VKVLIVEDSKATRELIAATCTSIQGVEVVLAMSGFEALKVLPRHRFSLIITDINMPDINGLELISFIRKSELHSKTPVLIISTQSSERDRARGLSLGANGYLRKPFTPEALQDEVWRVLASEVAEAKPHG